MKVRTDAPGWFVVEPIRPGLSRIEEPAVHRYLRCNIWLLEGRDRNLVIDTGIGVVNLRPTLEGILPAEPIAVATHAHVDHAGGLDEFTTRLGHGSERALFNDLDLFGPPRLDRGAEQFGDASDLRYADRLLSALPRDNFPLGDHDWGGTPLTGTLLEGDIVDLGDQTLEVLELPGHSQGSIGLLDRTTRELFSGDAIYDDILLDNLPGSDRSQYVATMERLLTLDIDVVHGGHAPSFDRTRLHEIASGYLDRTR